MYYFGNEIDVVRIWLGRATRNYFFAEDNFDRSLFGAS